ncbi:MAG: PAS domain-containing protein, partial [Chloroflexota bacterium]
MDTSLASFGLLIFSVWILAALALVLHFTRTQYGLSLLLMYTAAIVGVVTYVDPITVFSEPLPGIILTMPADVFIPIILLVILTVYIYDGTDVAQVVILGVVLIQVLIALTFIVISLTVFNPGTREGNEIIAIARLSGVDLQFMLASIIAFIVDMYVINIVYQTIYNATRRLQPIGTWLAVGLALLSALWTDTLIFNLVAELGRGGFSELVVGDFLSKTVSGLVLLPVLIFYINHVAPPQHENSNNRYRPPFDIAHNMFGDWQQKLHQLQFELRSSELNSNQLIRNIREIFWIADENHGNAYFISPAFDDIVGKTRGEFYLSADTIYNRVHPDDVQRVQPRWLSYVEQPHEIEFRLLRDEQEIWLDRAYLVGDDELNIQRVIGLTEDITMQKQKAQLEKEIEIEKEKIRLLHDLIREVAHDIQSPITALGLKVDLLERVVDNPERQHKYLTQLKRQTLQLSQLVEYLFTLLRVETRPQKRHEIAAIQEMCQQVVDELFPFAQDKDLNIELNLSKQ